MRSLPILCLFACRVTAVPGGGSTRDTDSGDSDQDPSSSSSYHPDGWSDPEQHGYAAKLKQQQCTACHGDDLAGVGDAVSCDGCHEDGWRTNCTYCHGDPADGTGSPPVHIDGSDNGQAASFIPHRVHTDTTNVKAALDCTECHAAVSDVLSPGHLFAGDDTPGLAETDFSAGLSAAASWNGAGCANLYCHGNGRGDNGAIDHDESAQTCSDCHASSSSSSSELGTMSGEHRNHLGEGTTCYECHETTVDSSMSIVNVDLHANGVKDVSFTEMMTFENGTCTGLCHFEMHYNNSW